MDDLSKMTLAECKDSKFIRPLRLNYRHAGKDKVWDVVLCHSSVYIIIYNASKKKMVFVKQFRPAVYFSHIRRDKLPESTPMTPGTSIDVSSTPGSLGITLELCAGIVDKSKPLIEVAKEEIEEECGFKVPLNKIQEIQTCYAAVGIGGERTTFFYAEVTDDMKVGQGGGVEEEGELIEVVELSLDEVKDLMKQTTLNTTPPTLYGITWFLMNKA